MSLFSSLHLRFIFVLLLATLLAAGCSSSSNSSTKDLADGQPQGSGSSVQNTTLVNFDITVPEYASTALQVRLIWGDKNITAKWVVDESWAISDSFPSNTENQLLVTFSDANGAITLGSVETTFKTGMSTSQSFQISADQFNTAKWDSDGDGISNLDELIAGTNPGGAELPQAVQASMGLMPDKLFRITWQVVPNAQSYRVLENPDGISGFTDISGVLEATTSFDHRVALYSRVNAQYLVQACNDQGCVDSDPLFVTGTLDNAIGYFKASNADARDQFGFSVSLSANGNTLAVGAHEETSSASGVDGDQTDNSYLGTGAVYIFERNAGRWQQENYLKPNMSDDGDKFGRTVSLSADGNTLAVGATGEDSPATGINGDQYGYTSVDSGAVYVFERSNASWEQEAYIKSSINRERDGFGGSIGLSADGNTLAVGAGLVAVDLFDRNNGSWRHQTYLQPSNPGAGDGFGQNISLSADGNTLAVGAAGDDSDATGINGDQNNNASVGSGAAFVFKRNNQVWQQQAYLKASVTDDYDGFGRYVALSGDGNTLAVAAPFEGSSATNVNGDQNDNSGDRSGAAYIFVLNNGSWEEQAYLKASNTDEKDFFGQSLSLSADGNTLAVGVISERSSSTGVNGDQNDNSFRDAGAVYVYERSNGNWRHLAYLKASNTDRADQLGNAGGRFGGSVSLSAGGDTLAVGAPLENNGARGINSNQYDDTAEHAGAVYLF